MPVTHLLDTSVYSQPMKKTPAQHAMTRWQAIGDTAIVTSVICEAEVIYGILNDKRKNSTSKLGERYAALLKGKFDVLPVDRAVVEAYAELRDDLFTRNRTVGDMDLLIAATARVNNLIIATLNLSDFHVINGVSVEDWSQPLPG
jgi:tRNA(fMet)-specific endonuclease VapC